MSVGVLLLSHRMSEARKICPTCGTRYSAGALFCPHDGSPLSASGTDVSEDPYAGLLIQDAFEIKQLIGIGSMGRVYRALQRGLDREVAIKILHRDLLADASLVARFNREGRVAAALPHPNIVQVLLVGELPRGAERTDGEAFIVLEHLDGMSLRSALKAAGGAMPLARALHVILQVCDSAGEAHARGVIHRDLNPDNVMLVRRGDDPDYVKLVDFGVARADWLDSSFTTQAGAIVGTASYISPEGAQGKKVDARGDVYSIAAMLFHCLAGRPLFEGDNSVSVLYKHASEQAPDVRSIPRGSYVPEPIARLLASNLEKNVLERCRDARELGRMLLQTAVESGLSADDLSLRATLLGSAGRTLDIATGRATRTKTLDSNPAPNAPSPRSDAAPRGPGDTQIDEGNVLPKGPAVERTSVHDGPPSFASEPASISIARPAPGPRRRRGLVAALATAAALLASALTVVLLRREHEPAEPSAQVFVDRARAALREERYDSPPGENVLDLTTSALRKWPGHAGLWAVRKEAAKRLMDRATALAHDRPEEGLARADLATELDPDNQRARQLLDEVTIPRPGAGPPADAPSAGSPPAALRAESTPPAVPRHPPPKPRREPSAATPPDAGRTPQRVPTAEGDGRWL